MIDMQRRRRTVRLTLHVASGVVLLGAGTAASHYADTLWFESLGLASVAAPLSAAAPADIDASIAGAAGDFADYQRLTAAAKLAEAAKKLESLKRAVEELQARRQ